MLSRTLSKFGNAGIPTITPISTSSSTTTIDGSVNASDVTGLNGTILSVIDAQNLANKDDLLTETKTNSIKYSEDEFLIKNPNDETMISMTMNDVNINKPLYTQSVILDGIELNNTTTITKNDLQEIDTNKINLPAPVPVRMVQIGSALEGTTTASFGLFGVTFNQNVTLTKIIFPAKFVNSNGTRSVSINSHASYSVTGIANTDNIIELPEPLTLSANTQHIINVTPLSGDGYWTNDITPHQSVVSIEGLSILVDLEYKVAGTVSVDGDFVQSLAVQNSDIKFNSVDTQSLLINSIPFVDPTQTVNDMEGKINDLDNAIINISAEVPTSAEMLAINTTLQNIKNVFQSLGITSIDYLNTAIENTEQKSNNFLHGDCKSTARMVFLGDCTGPDDGPITSEIVFANDLSETNGFDIDQGWNYSIASRNYTNTQTFEISDIIQGHKNTVLTFKGDPTSTDSWIQHYNSNSSASSTYLSNVPSNVYDNSTSTQWISEGSRYLLDGLPDLTNSSLAKTTVYSTETKQNIYGEWHDTYFSVPRRIARLVLNSHAKEVTILRKNYTDEWEIVLENHECTPDTDFAIDFPTSKPSVQYRIIITQDKDYGATRIYYMRWWTRNFNNIAEFQTEVQAQSFRTLGHTRTLEERILAIEQHLGIA